MSDRIVMRVGEALVAGNDSFESLGSILTFEDWSAAQGLGRPVLFVQRIGRGEILAAASFCCTWIGPDLPDCCLGVDCGGDTGCTGPPLR